MGFARRAVDTLGIPDSRTARFLLLGTMLSKPKPLGHNNDVNDDAGPHPCHLLTTRSFGNCLSDDNDKFVPRHFSGGFTSRCPKRADGNTCHRSLAACARSYRRTRRKAKMANEKPEKRARSRNSRSRKYSRRCRTSRRPD